MPLRLVTDLRLGFEGRGAHARTTLHEGEGLRRPCGRARLVAGGDCRPRRHVEEAYERMERTAEYWRHWLNQGEFPEHPWQLPPAQRPDPEGPDLRPTGALLAAATTSLPETPGGERNWDYRYTWIRDATFTLWGLYTLGFDREANDFFYFVADVFGGEDETPDHVRGRGREGAARGGAATT